VTATKPVSQEHIEIVEGVSGPKARIIGHRIRVKDIVSWHEHQQVSVDEIVEQFPQLTHGDVYAALAYYWDHKAEIDASMAADEAFVEEMRRSAPPSRFQELLKQRGLR
jgi:uncharacterized protein (DUF433 family)